MANLQLHAAKITYFLYWFHFLFAHRFNNCSFNGEYHSKSVVHRYR